VGEEKKQVLWRMDAYRFSSDLLGAVFHLLYQISLRQVQRQLSGLWWESVALGDTPSPCRLREINLRLKFRSRTGWSF
jgi:hypothetical protein